MTTMLSLLLLAVMIAVTMYTDLRYRKIYNKFLLPCLAAGIALHLWMGDIGAALIALLIGFGFFLFVWIFGMTSPGDVKLYGVLSLVVGDSHVVAGGIIFYTFVQLVVSVWAFVCACRRQKVHPLKLLAQDAIAFRTKTVPVITPVRFPGAVLMGAGVCMAEAFFLMV